MTDVTQASMIFWERGVRILQGNRLGNTDAEHVDALAKHMGLNGERNVADMGCGFGGVSKLLSEKLPEARFWLINKNGWQLSKCPEEPQFWWFNEDMCSTSIAGGRVDMVMFNWSLCHANVFMALSEAHRITNEKGRLFVYDLERVSGDNVETKEVLNAVFSSDAEFRSACDATGWREVETIHPGGDDTMFRESCCDDELYDRLTKGLIPVIWKARK